MMYFSMKILILLLFWLHIITCAVYTVIPNNHNTTCDHCHTLQYYQLNINKYFNSNTQLFFLPGSHYLHTDLVLQNIHNISLIGLIANAPADTVMIIQYAKLAQIAMINVTNLNIKNLIVQRNASLFDNSENTWYSSIIFRDCLNVLVNHLQIYIISESGSPFKFTSLTLLNVLGKSQLSHILCHNMLISYDETKIKKGDGNLLIDDYQTQNKFLLSFYTIILSIKQTSYRVTVQISNTTAAYYVNSFISIECNRNSGNFRLIITGCQFRLNYFGLFSNQIYDGSKCNGIIYFTNNKFLSNAQGYDIITIHGIVIQITDCTFYNGMIRVYQSSYSTKDSYVNNVGMVNITNTHFSYTIASCGRAGDHIIIDLENTAITFSGTVIFTNITCRDTIISLREFSTITINGFVKFLNNHVNKLINFKKNKNQFIFMKESAAIEITQNKVCTFFNTIMLEPIPYPFCFFQYIDDEKYNESIMQKNFSITFHYNNHEATNPYLDPDTIPSQTTHPNPLYPSWPYNLFETSYSNPYINPLLGDNTSDKNPSCVIYWLSNHQLSKAATIII